MSTPSIRILACLSLVLAASPNGLAQSTPSVLEKSVAGNDGAIPWTIAGDWLMEHAGWKAPKTVTIRPDGTFLAWGGSGGGKWILSADGGTPLLVLRWELWGTESVAMISPDHFRGQHLPHQFIDIRRISDDAGQKTAKESETAPDLTGEWHVENLNDGTKAVYNLNADNTFDRNGERTGTWEVKDNQLIMHYSRGGFGRYELAEPGVPLKGVNDLGQALTLVRVAKNAAKDLPKDLVGAWHVENLTDGSKAEYDIFADKTFDRDGGRTGTWEVKNNQLILHYDRGGLERYEPSGQDASLKGVNDLDQNLTLTRSKQNPSSESPIRAGASQ